jgi:hypothetical protein
MTFDVPGNAPLFPKLLLNKSYATSEQFNLPLEMTVAEGMTPLFLAFLFIGVATAFGGSKGLIGNVEAKCVSFDF